MAKGSKPYTAAWYIVLQPVFLKNESNCAILSLAPNQKILVEKWWVVRPNKFLAQVLYPARGYIHLEHNTLGQPITCLVPGGPEEQLPNKPLKTGNKVIGSHSEYYRIINKEHSVSAEDNRTICQSTTSYPASDIIPRSNSQWGNKSTNEALLPPQYRNQRTQFITLEKNNVTGCLSKKIQKVNTPSELIHVSSSKVSIHDTSWQVDGRRYSCNLFCPTLATHDSTIASSGPGYFCSSAYSHRVLSNLPVVSHFNHNVNPAQWSDNFSHQRPDGEERSDNSNVFVDPEHDSDFSRRQCLQSIYHSYNNRVRPTAVKDAEIAKEPDKTTISDQISVAEEKLQEKQHLAGLCYYQGHWRYDSDRWITVSALCHSLQVICRKKKQGVKTNGVQQNMIFHSTTVPDISLPAYLKRVAWFLGCPTASFVLTLEYVYRLAQYCPEVEVNDNSVHQIVITCIMVATKFICDKSIKNSFYARIAGLPGANLAAFEVQLTFLLKFDLYVLPAHYDARYQSMLEENKGPSMVIIRPEAIGVDGDES